MIHACTSSEEPHLFSAAVEAQLDRLGDQIEAEEASGEVGASVDSSQDNETTSLVLFKRIRDMRRLERRREVEDLMYAGIIQKFMNIRVDMLPPLDEDVLIPGVNLNNLTEGVHSVEALEMVREHLLAVLGPQSETAYSNQLVRMSKLQAAQVYAASIMFGYFVKRADSRFQLDKKLGTLPLDPLESAKALEQIFNAASAMDSIDEVDLASNLKGAGSGPGGMFDVDTATGDVTASGEESDNDVDAAAAGEGPGVSGFYKGGSATLKQYIQSFDQETLSQTARIVSMEGVALAERQTGALFGSIDELQKEMQQAIGDVSTPQELMERVQEVVGAGDVKTLTLPYSAQRRIVLEAVAFGTFLRDVETYVDGYNEKLLTPVPKPGQLPPGSGGSAPDGPQAV